MGVHLISAVLADIDGTLVTKEKVLTERAIAAVGRLRERGVVFTICSSRSPRGMSDVLYIKALAAPFTVNTIPEATLLALADHGEVTGLLPACEDVLKQFAGAGVDLQGLAVKLQADGAASFVKSWHSLLAVIAAKSATISAAT